MSPYAQTLANARLEALRALIAALHAADSPAEIRRCAVAILNAPDPCEIDDAIQHAHTRALALPDNSPHNHSPNAPRTGERPSASTPTPAPTSTNIASENPPLPPPATRASVGCQWRKSLDRPPIHFVAHEMRERLPNLTSILDLIAPPNLPALPRAPAARLLARAGLPP